MLLFKNFHHKKRRTCEGGVREGSLILHLPYTEEYEARGVLLFGPTRNIDEEKLRDFLPLHPSSV